MTKKELVFPASRVMALYLIVWSLVTLPYVPIDAFSLSHERALSAATGHEYSYNHYLLLLSYRLALSATQFIAAIWIYRCGPFIQRFLSPKADGSSHLHVATLFSASPLRTPLALSLLAGRRSLLRASLR